MEDKVVPLHPDSIKDFPDWLTKIAANVGDVPKFAILLWEDDEGRVLIHEYNISVEKMTYLAAYANDYATTLRNE